MAAALAVAGCQPTPTQLPVSTASPVPVSSLVTPTNAPTAEPMGFGDGVHRVGVDVQPGTYRAIAEPTSDPEGFCFWERTSGFGGSEAEIIGTSAGIGPRVVTIDPDDVGFVSERCGEWTSDLGPLTGPIGDGVWIVGVDLPPGAYVSDGGVACVWQRLSGFGGTSDESLEVGLSGSVEIAATDGGFSSSHCGTWLPSAS